MEGPLLHDGSLQPRRARSSKPDTFPEQVLRKIAVADAVAAAERVAVVALVRAANGPAVSDSANGDLAGVVLVRAHEGAPGRRLSSLLLWTEAVAQTIACLDFL
jgi:hypothetical protein